MMSRHIGRLSLYITSIACTAELPRDAVCDRPSGREFIHTRLLQH